MYEYKCEVVNIVDGDTVDIRIDLGFNLGFTQRFRLFGINTPEKIGVSAEEKIKAIAAQEYLREIAYGKTLIAQTHRDKKDKYGRYLVVLCDLSGPVNDEPFKTINQLMVESGHAVRYMD